MQRMHLAAIAAAVTVAGTASASQLSLLDDGTGFWEAGTDYASASPEWFAVARHAASVGDWEMGAGDGISAGFDQGHLTWTDGETYGFELAYDGDVLTWSMSLDGSLLESVSYDVTSGSFDTVMLQLKARNDQGGTAMGMVSNLTWDDGDGAEAVAGSSIIMASNYGSGADKAWAALGGAGGLGDSSWTLAGDLMMTWQDGTPTRDNLALEFKAVQVVPVPAPVLMAGVGLLGAAVMRRRLR